MKICPAVGMFFFKLTSVVLLVFAKDILKGCHLVAWDFAVV